MLTHVSVAMTSAPLAASSWRPDDGDAPPGLRRDLGGAGQDGAVRLVAVRRADAHVHARRRSAEKIRMRHVVGAVPEVRERQPCQRVDATPGVGDCGEVRKDLARVELVGERVDNGHARDRGHLLDPLLPVGAPHDGSDLAVQNLRGVGDGFAPAHLGATRVDDEREAPELGDADGEGDARAGGVLVEEHGDGLGAEEGLRVVPVALERERELEDLPLFGGGEVVVPQEVARHDVPFVALAARKPASQSVNVSASAAVRYQRGHEPDGVGARGVDDEASLARRRDRVGGHRRVELDAEHEALAAHVRDAGDGERRLSGCAPRRPWRCRGAPRSR